MTTTRRPRAVETTCFSCNRKNAWENFLNDEMMQIMSLGHWSRTELVRSFVRRAEDDAIFPTVYQARLYCGGASESAQTKATGDIPSSSSTSDL